MAERVRDAAPVLTAVVVYGHQPSASTQIMTAAGHVCTAIKQLSPEQQVSWSAATWPLCRSGPCAKSKPTSWPLARGCTRWSALVEALKTPCPDLRAGARACVTATTAGRAATPDRPLVADLDERMPGRPGICCRWTATGPTTGTVSTAATGSLTPRSTPHWAALTTVLSAASRRRFAAANGGGHARDRPTVTATGARTAVIAQIDMLVNDTACATSRSPMRCSC